ncbi:DUF4124 domain-containing protein [Thalassolituus sp. LLYu03]|uniref:DUF4124 domain-containing protein n=1 Tax=Thalassolituus sp. LLYu03 TaxID=3421656 RepID=UPI003D297516
MLKAGCLTRIVNVTSVLLAVALSPVPAYGEIYRWTDANGQVHFSDKPKAGEQVTTYQPEASLNPYEAQQPQTLKSTDAYRADEEAAKARKKQQRIEAERQQAADDKRKRQCDKARMDLRIYNTQRTGATDLSAMMRKRQYRDQLNDRVKQYCR